MTVGHRTNRLKLVGIPEVEQLQNGRYQLTVNCTPLNKREAWYNSNKSRIFPDFGSLQSAEMSIDGLAPRTGEAYTDMGLVSVQSRSQGDDYIVTLVYQTLGSSFVQVKDDTVDLELNGLRRVTRTSIAQAGTDFQKTVGTDFIDHQIDSETAVRCFLASYQIDDTDSFREVEEVYLQAGEISRDINQVGDGVLQTTFRTFITDPSTVSGEYVLSRDIENFSGFQTIVTSVISKADGTTLTGADGSEKLATEKEEIVNFTFPGVVDLKQESNHIFPVARSPVQCKVKADVYTYYQTSNDIVSGDFTKESSLGFWNPSEWCQKISSIDSFVNERGTIVPAYYNAQGIRGCRTRTSVTLSAHDVEIDDYQSHLASISVTGGGISGSSGTTTLGPLALDETIETSNGKSVFSSNEVVFTYDVVLKITHAGLGVIKYGKAIQVTGKTQVKIRYNSSNKWEIVQISSRSDPNPTSSTAWPSGPLHFRARLNSYASGGYTNATVAENETILAQSTTTGDNSPSGLTYVTTGGASTTNSVSASSNEESLVAMSLTNSTVESVSVGTSANWIEGRRVGFGAVGKISISGGPPDPLGRKYTLAVNFKRAFTDKNGTNVYQKQIVIATCTPI